MISVCILTKNASVHIKQTLDSIVPFSEVLILDNGSNDDTIAIAQTYRNVRIEYSPFLGFGPLRNKAASIAKNDWILAIDSDEIVSPSLLEELTVLRPDPRCAYAILRRNFYNGKQIKGCGWHPDWIVRLYHRKTTAYTETSVHESVSMQNLQKVRLTGFILHTPYRSTGDFLAKMQHYTTLFAMQNQGKKKSSLTKAMTHALFTFIKSYFLKRGFLDGAEGFIISLYNANTAFYKYLKLKELNYKAKDLPTHSSKSLDLLSS